MSFREYLLKTKYPALPADDGVDEGNTGKQRDTESGLDFFGARYYGSTLFRWTSPDAPFEDNRLEDPQSWNLYRYSSNNPVNRFDPNGEADAVAETMQLGRDLIKVPSVPAKAVGVCLLAVGTIYVAAKEIDWHAVGKAAMKSFEHMPAGDNPVSRNFERRMQHEREQAQEQQVKSKTEEAQLQKENQHTPEQKDLVDMAKRDKQKGGITEGDMEAYKDLNKEAGAKGFPEKGSVRGPETHPPRTPQSKPGPGQQPHGHVGPVDHIPVKPDPPANAPKS